MLFQKKYGMLASAAFFTALAMVFVNFLFMVAGNIPEYEGCVFLNGNSSSFLLLFPIVAFIVSNIHTHFSFHAFMDERETVLRCMRYGVLLGSILYFVIGACCAGESFVSYAGNLTLIMTIYSLLMMVFAQLGALFAIQRTMKLNLS